MSIIVKCLISTAVIMLGTWLLRVVNLRREFRGRQILMSYLSLPLALTGVICGYVFWRHGTGVFGDFFEDVEIIGWNIQIIAGFLAVKIILLPIMKSVWSSNSRMELTSDTWYEYDGDYGRWFLRSRYRNVRNLLNVLSWVISGITTAVIAMGWSAGEGSALNFRVFPAAAMVLVTELYNFLSGYTKPEYLHTVDGENITFSRVGAYYKLRKIYEKLFPAALLVSHTGNEFGSKQGTTDLIHSLIESEDRRDQIVGRFFAHQKKNAGAFDVDMISVTNKLIHRQSATILNPFFRDLSDYMLLPFVDNLVNNKKCLVVVGRGYLRDDVIDWASDLMKKYSRTKNLWRVRSLDSKKPDCEIGVLSISQIYDTAVINSNSEFFQKLGFVLLIEPSKMIPISQAGLNIIVEKIDKQNEPTYCICDHDVDGLVDTMSHVLQTNLTTVAAAPVPRSIYTAMGWSASGDYMRQKLFDKQTHYLGNGIELAAVAIKNQIPHVTWYSSEKAPVQDIKWLAGQYYPQICRYTHLPNQQKSINEHLSFTSNLWGATVKDQEFVIAEDEFCNLFATIRTYLTRGTSQSFVNVISENYMLRDYMRYNRQLFMSDPKAIPAVAPHYAKTERNTIIKLILMMACHPVEEAYIAHELSILGYDSENVYRSLCQLITRYTFIKQSVVTVQNRQELDKEMVPVQVCSYSISRSVFDENFANTLKNAFFVVEDEKLNAEYIDARLFEHITQTVMPGQYVVYNGKYYKVHFVSPQVGCVLHRAADEYRNRLYYRQLRCYQFSEECETVNVRRIMDVEIARERRNFKVFTSGYLEMKDDNDLRSARHIDLSADPGIDAFNRSFKNKSVLRIALPETDVHIRFTITLLLSEIFRTIFPDSWPYIAVLCKRPEDIEGMLDKLTYRVEGNVDDDMIYIVEDSDMDLGLLEAVDNNLMRFFEIIADYLTWHFEKMKESPAEDPVLEPIELATEKETKRKSLFSRIAQKIMRIFQASDEKEHEKPVEKEEPKENKPEEKPKEAEVSPFGPEENEQKKDRDQLPETEEKADLPQDFELQKPENDQKNEEPQPVNKETEKQEKQEADSNVSATQETEEPKHDNQVSEEKPEKNEAEGTSAPQATAEKETDAQKTEEQEKPEQETVKEEPAFEPLPNEQIVLHTEGEDLFAVDGVADDLDILMPIEPTRYQKECFLKFGFDEIDARLDIEKVSSYLNVRGWGSSDLRKARKRTELEPTVLDLNTENCCDFCGIPLSGVSYEQLADGRVRCNECAMTAINQVSEFRELFRNTEMMMENTFEIMIPVPIAVRTTDARTIGRKAGMVFKPSTQFASRVLGFAQNKNGEFSLYVENGSPRLAVIDTTTHELTHIWQYFTWKDRQIRKIYAQSSAAASKLARDIVYEGMAMWASIQLLYVMGETAYAQQQEGQTEARKDVYGMGFILYRDRYGLERGGNTPAFSPFASYPPLDPDEVRRIIEGGC